VDHERRHTGGVSAVTFAAVIALAVACGGNTGNKRDTTPLPAPPVIATTSGAPSSAPTSTSTPTSTPTTKASKPGARPAGTPHRKGSVLYVTPHVMLVMLENKGYAATLGSCFADPYLCGLGARYASVVGWTGVGHPSLPNYLAVTTGSMQGCTSDTCSGNYTPSLGGQLNTARIPWVAWMESMPSACATTDSNPYVWHHNPFVREGDSQCSAHDVNYPGASQAVATLTGGAAPEFVWITPNINNDMHSGSVQAGDAWLKANIAPVLASSWFTGADSTVIITMDEGDPGNTNAIPQVIISNNSIGHGNVSIVGNLYGTLRTIEQEFGLPLLGNAQNPSNGDLYGYFG
jgi:phosphatidylinositol-3-phosphatase